MFTQPFSFAGLPVIAAPVVQAGALPLGVQITARAGGEMTLLKLAAEREKASPWAHRYSQIRI